MWWCRHWVMLSPLPSAAKLPRLSSLARLFGCARVSIGSALSMEKSSTPIRSTAASGDDLPSPPFWRTTIGRHRRIGVVGTRGKPPIDPHLAASYNAGGHGGRPCWRLILPAPILGRVTDRRRCLKGDRTLVFAAGIVPTNSGRDCPTRQHNG